MDEKELKKGLRKLRSSIEDFLDAMDMDAEEKPKSIDAVKDNFEHPNARKSSSDAEEDMDGRKKSH